MTDSPSALRRKWVTTVRDRTAPLARDTRRAVRRSGAWPGYRATPAA
jgi:hypothetical protein